VSNPAAYFTYILRCSDSSYYVGHTDNLTQPIAWHHQGHGATWTAKRRPVTLVYSETHATEAEAVRRERQIKRWSRAKKEALIAGDRIALKRLGRRRT
jgi:predicted GIY-YIG superfamily endonuclease